MRNIRLFPKIRYTNFKKKFPISATAFSRLFYIEKHWSGKIIEIGIKHHQISFDFRKNWLLDMFPSSKESTE